jgi:hypothetical protein
MESAVRGEERVPGRDADGVENLDGERCVHEGAVLRRCGVVIRDGGAGNGRSGTGLR